MVSERLAISSDNLPTRMAALAHPVRVRTVNVKLLVKLALYFLLINKRAEKRRFRARVGDARPIATTTTTAKTMVCSLP